MISFTIHGEPVAKARARITVRKGKVRGYTLAKTADYENMVAHYGKIAMIGTPVLDGALFMSLNIYVAIPVSWSKKKKFKAFSGEIMPTKRPDSDNYLKGVSDALNGIVYKDDSQIVDHKISKRYSDFPRIEVRVSKIGMEA